MNMKTDEGCKAVMNVFWKYIYILELNVQVLIDVRYISLGRKNTNLQKSHLGLNIYIKFYFIVFLGLM